MDDASDDPPISSTEPHSSSSAEVAASAVAEPTIDKLRMQDAYSREGITSWRSIMKQIAFYTCLLFISVLAVGGHHATQGLSPLEVHAYAVNFSIIVGMWTLSVLALILSRLHFGGRAMFKLAAGADLEAAIRASKAGRTREIMWVVESWTFKEFAPWLIYYDLIVLCAIIMCAFESANEEEERVDFVAFMRAKQSIVKPEAYQLLQREFGDPDDPLWRNWDVSGCIYYCWTLITTVGYGSFGPATDGGKQFSIVLMFGALPLYGYLLGKSGQGFLECTLGWFLRYTGDKVRKQLSVNLKAGQRLSEVERHLFANIKLARLYWLYPNTRAFIQRIGDRDLVLSRTEIEQLVETIVSRRAVSIQFLFTTTCMILIVVVVPLCNPPMDGWSQIDSLYWSVSTTSTVGLGDLAVSYDPDVRITFPYALPTDDYRAPFSHWQLYLDPMWHIWWITIFTVNGAVINSIVNYVTDMLTQPSRVSLGAVMSEKLRVDLLASSALDAFRRCIEEGEDGTITRKEFRSSIRGLGIVATKGDMDAAFHFFDASGNGEIDMRELQEGLDALKSTASEPSKGEMI